MVTKGRLSSLSYCESNLLLIARGTIQLLVNHQLIPISIQSKSILLEQILLEQISMYCPNFTVLSSFFDVKKQRPTMNLEKSSQFCVNIEISLDLKVYFSLVMCKINNLIALRSNNQIIKISALWWLCF